LLNVGNVINVINVVNVGQTVLA